MLALRASINCASCYLWAIIHAPNLHLADSIAADLSQWPQWQQSMYYMTIAWTIGRHWTSRRLIMHLWLHLCAPDCKCTWLPGGTSVHLIASTSLPGGRRGHQRSPNDWLVTTPLCTCFQLHHSITYLTFVCIDLQPSGQITKSEESIRTIRSNAFNFVYMSLDFL